MCTHVCTLTIIWSDRLYQKWYTWTIVLISSMRELDRGSIRPNFSTATSWSMMPEMSLHEPDGLLSQHKRCVLLRSSFQRKEPSRSHNYKKAGRLVQEKDHLSIGLELQKNSLKTVFINSNQFLMLLKKVFAWIEEFIKAFAPGGQNFHTEWGLTTYRPNIQRELTTGNWEGKRIPCMSHIISHYNSSWHVGCSCSSTQVSAITVVKTQGHLTKVQYAMAQNNITRWSAGSLVTSILKGELQSL